MSIQGSINQIAGIVGNEIDSANEAKAKATKEAAKKTANPKATSISAKAQEAISKLEEQYQFQRDMTQSVSERLEALQQRISDPNFAVEHLKEAGVLSNTRAKDITHKLKKVGDKIVSSENV